MEFVVERGNLCTGSDLKYLQCRYRLRIFLFNKNANKYPVLKALFLLLVYSVSIFARLQICCRVSPGCCQTFSAVYFTSHLQDTDNLLYILVLRATQLAISIYKYICDVATWSMPSVSLTAAAAECRTSSCRQSGTPPPPPPPSPAPSRRKSLRCSCGRARWPAPRPWWRPAPCCRCPPGTRLAGTSGACTTSGCYMMVGSSAVRCNTAVTSYQYINIYFFALFCKWHKSCEL